MGAPLGRAHKANGYPLSRRERATGTGHGLLHGRECCPVAYVSMGRGADGKISGRAFRIGCLCLAGGGVAAGASRRASARGQDSEQTPFGSALSSSIATARALPGSPIRVRTW